MAKVEFASWESKIEEALNKKAEQEPYKSTEGGFLLVKGFDALVLQESVGSDVGYVLGGTKTLPLVVAAGKKTGQIYSFPLKVLLPEVEF